MAMRDVDEQEVQDNFCEACKGFPDYCMNDCDGFKIAYLMCELGLDEDWDWIVPATSKEEKELLAALRLIKKILVDVEKRLAAMKPITRPPKERVIGGSSEPQADKSNLSKPPE